MGTRTDFLGTLTTSRPLTPEELEEYKDSQEDYESDMYLTFVSNSELGEPDYEKVCGYMDIEKGFMSTLNWLQTRGITLSGRINYVSAMFSDVVGGGFGAFVATPENVMYYKLDFTNLKMVSSIIYSKSV